jgi:hypothetical protein
MNPTIRISWGELFDRIAILEIKLERLQSDTARANVKRELEELRAATGETQTPDLITLKTALKHVNETLWQIEDDIREKESAKCFDSEFVEFARAVYINNDERGRIKQKINALLKSEIGEEKQYSRY